MRRFTRNYRAAFTLIELIAVMSIILILAGLILGIAGHAQHEASVRRAESEIHGLGAAIEAYKVDNGSYPRDSAKTDVLNAQSDVDPGKQDHKYQDSSEFLYQCLSGYIPPVANANVAPTGKPYFSFKSNQLAAAADGGGSTATVTPTSPYMYVQDPFGFAYGYSTANIYAVENNPNSPDVIAKAGFNPTYDLWSTSGYAQTGGKGTPTNVGGGSSTSVYSNLWEKNW